MPTSPTSPSQSYTGTLDHIGQIPVTFNLPSGEGETHCEIDCATLSSRDSPTGIMLHFMHALALQSGQMKLPATLYYDRVTARLHLRSRTQLRPDQPLTLTFYDEPILRLNPLAGGGWAFDPALQDIGKLSGNELRELSTYHVAPPPDASVMAPRSALGGFDPALHAPITDLHTHSSAQLTAEELMKLALTHQLSYPVELLEKIGIALSAQQRALCVQGYGSRFSPLEHEGLACERQNAVCDMLPLDALDESQRTQLQSKFNIPQDTTLSFSDFDREYYRYVNPLVKNPALTHDMILQIARDYRKAGIRYAELSTASMLNLDAKGQATWFREMCEAVAQAQKETGVTMRFLVGVPRNYDPAQVMVELEKIKFAARHPYIVGVDLLGYEYNRTSDFSATLSHIANWARAPEGTELDPKNGWDFQRDFTIRIHAGETGKNHGNVAEAVDLAEKYGVRVRIAHAINQADDAALYQRICRLANHSPPLVSFEFCSFSNLAYNNIPSATAVPYQRWISHCPSWFIGSDGAGAIQTTPVQLALSALHGGLTLEDLRAMRANEETFIAHARECEQRKTDAYRGLYPQDDDFFDAYAAHLAQVNRLSLPKPAHSEPRTDVLLPSRYAQRTPILVAGAGGRSFQEMSAREREEIEQGIEKMVEKLDPQKVYFVTGRSKPEGVTQLLDAAITRHNEAFPDRKFLMLSLITEGTRDLPRNIDWCVTQPGKRDSVPDNIMRFMHQAMEAQRNPLCLFFGGSNFTSDMILKARQNGLPHGLYAGDGSSQVFALKSSPDKRFDSPDSLHALIGRHDPALLAEPTGRALRARARGNNGIRPVSSRQ